MCSTSRSFLQFPAVEEIRRRRRVSSNEPFLLGYQVEEARKEQENEKDSVALTGTWHGKSSRDGGAGGLGRITFHSDDLRFGFADFVWLCERVASPRQQLQRGVAQ